MHDDSLGLALLAIARNAIAAELDLAVDGAPHHAVLDTPGATFVTLFAHGELRGCVGTLEPRRPLAIDVRENALGAAFRDSRFLPLTAVEFAATWVDVSLLSPSESLKFTGEEDLLRQLNPGVDGLTLVRQYRGNPATKDLPIIVLSSKEDATVKSEAFTAGANDYLVKLPDKVELVARLRLHSNAYANQLQRDEAYRALRESQRQLLLSNATLLSLNQKLENALSKVKQLSGLVPICSYCKRIRTDENYWEQVDRFVAEHSEVRFSHGICPSCYKTFLAEYEAST